MADFLLVHGAWHGAWCWDELVPELAARGHRAQAIDLPGAGQDRTPPQEVTLEGCARHVADALNALPGKAWLVGHSMGGASITQAAELAPDRIEALVYVAAGLPLNGQSFFDAVGQEEPGRVQEVMVSDEATGAGHVPPEHLKACFYHRCSEAQIERAKTLLTTWQGLAPGATPMSLTPERAGRVPRYYVECLQDQAIVIGAQRRMQAAAGVRAAVTLDTDHSPFFSCPAALADALDGFVRM
jgi:pimeloyl-ACP methyl ester carboxylesterase